MTIRATKALATLALFVQLLPGCGGQAGGGGDGGGGGGGAGTGGPVLPGQLTAGEWDDNDYFDFFLTSLDGLFAQDRQVASVDVTDRIVMTVTDDTGTPVSNAVVEIFDDNQSYLVAPTGTDGRLLYLPGVDGAPTDNANLRVRVTAENGASITLAAPAGPQWPLVVSGANATPPTALDIAFVIDATGSMSDELNYIKAEVAAISAGILRQASGASLNFGLIVYRDDGDAYTVRSFDFTGDLGVFRDNLGRQSASGGGDTPEAMDKALIAMNQLQWRNGNTARVAFLIADAPPHNRTAQRFLEEANVARLLGIKLFPVAASGVGQLTEYLMRAAAQLSLGRYVFLTDDSGIGGSHADPHIPCYQIELLRDLMVRTALSEFTGTRVVPNQSEILGVVGEFDGNRCVIPQDQGAQSVGN